MTKTPQYSSDNKEIWASDRVGGIRISYLNLPPSTDDREPKVSTPFAFDYAFTSHVNAVIETPGGHAQSRTIPPGTGGVTGGEPIKWLAVGEWFEVVEVLPDPEVLSAALSEFGNVSSDSIHNIFGVEDPLLWCAAARVRAHLRGGIRMTETDGDVLAHTIVEHMICEHFGGRPSRINARPLDRARLLRVTDQIEANLNRPIRLADLAETAALSPFHFIRAFKMATGITPNRFVVARKVERARSLLEAGIVARVSEAARMVGFTNVHHFRGLYASQFGSVPA